MELIDLLFGYKGRTSRGRFWLAVLIWTVFVLVVVGLAAMIVSSMTTVFRVALFAYVPVIISAIAVGIKRLQDRNKSGRWLLVFYGIPLAVFLIDTVLNRIIGTGSSLLEYASLVVIVWALVDLGCLRGTIGANQYGTDPIAPEILTPPVRTH